MEIALALTIFLVGYLINIFVITVLYHRGLAHGSVVLSPGVRRTVVRYGNWLTGLDPKAWSCMHRLHHRYSDQDRDPHSPLKYGVLGVMLGQLKSYRRVLGGLMRKESEMSALVADLDFEVNWLNQRRLWWIPYLTHYVVAIVFGLLTQSWMLGLAYYLGIMSHPIQGWMVNSLAHWFGYRNYDTPDNSKNNTMVALLVFGEGLQNNHHQKPDGYKFSHKRGEVDLGYYLAAMAEKLGWLKFNKAGA